MLSSLYELSVLKLAVTMSAPLIIAALGELLIERSGILNVGIEGMMIMGAAKGFLVSYFTGSNFLGMLAAMTATALFGLILAYFSVNLRANQLIVGLGLFVLGLGLPSLMYRLFIGVRLLAPQIPLLPAIRLPLLGSIPFLGEIFFNQPILVYVAFLMIPSMWFLLFKTPLGLRIRASGENPRAVDTLGINVFRIRFICVVVGCAIIGLGGAYLPMVLTGTFTEGMVGGRGWLSLMLVIFGRWMPQTVLLGALFFAYIEALQFRLAMTARAIPSQFFLMLPYIAAILVLVQIYRRAEAPEGLLKPYDREARS